MEPEILSGLIGFGGAVIGAVIGGGTSLIATKLSLNHQRDLAKEARLLELGETAVETALAVVEKIEHACSTLTEDELATRMEDWDIPWGDTTARLMSEVAMAVRRVPDRAVQDRVLLLIRLANKWRCAGNTYLMGNIWMISRAFEIRDVLTAYLCEDDLEPLPERILEDQRKADAYVPPPGAAENRRRRAAEAAATTHQEPRQTPS
ncbi:YtxH domain-containing protein [Streptomyces milbemycinicus]|uniref:YtxH domain-containing protein n=1 Tax=Streptomyces milbemycinicus TaxID=476552 RepID=UPI0033C3DA19